MIPNRYELDVAWKATLALAGFIISAAIVMRIAGVPFHGLTGAVTAWPKAGRGVHIATVILLAVMAGLVWGAKWAALRVITGGKDKQPSTDLSDMYEKPALKRAQQTVTDALLDDTNPTLPQGLVTTKSPTYSVSKRQLVRFMGTFNGKALFAPFEDPECVYAVTRSGKTRSIVARRVLEAPGPVVATSTKSDGIALTWLGLDRQGRSTLVFDPMGMAHGPKRIRWNPVLGCEDFDTARRPAVALATGATTKVHSGGGNTKWFQERGAQILGYLLHAAALTGRDITAVHAWVTRPADARLVLATYGTPVTEMMTQTLGDLMIDMAAETSSGFKGTMQGALEPLMVDSVLHTLTPPAHESFDAATWLAGNDVVWVLSPEAEGAVASITTMFTDYLLDAARRAADHAPGSRLIPAVSAILDEAANVAALPHLDALFSEGPGRGIFTCAIFQDNAQVEARWGRDIARIVFQQARAVYVLGGSKDNAWNKKISELSLEYEEARHSYSVGRMGPSVSTSTQRRHTLREGQIASLPRGQAVLAASGHDAVIVALPDIAADEQWGASVREGSRIYSDHLVALASAATATQRQYWQNQDQQWMSREPLPVHS